MREDNGYLSVTWGRMAVFCQLLQAGWLLSVSCMRQDGGFLSATWSSMAVICQLQWGRMAVFCQVHEAGWRLSVSYMRQYSVVFREFVYFLCDLKRDCGCLSATWCRMAIVCRVYMYSLTWNGMVLSCQLLEGG